MASDAELSCGWWDSGVTVGAAGSCSYFVLIIINFLTLLRLKEEAVVLCVLQRCFRKRLTRTLCVTPMGMFLFTLLYL